MFLIQTCKEKNHAYSLLQRGQFNYAFVVFISGWDMLAFLA